MWHEKHFDDTLANKDVTHVSATKHTHVQALQHLSTRPQASDFIHKQPSNHFTESVCVCAPECMQY